MCRVLAEKKCADINIPIKKNLTQWRARIINNGRMCWVWARENALIIIFLEDNFLVAKMYTRFAYTVYCPLTFRRRMVKMHYNWEVERGGGVPLPLPTSWQKNIPSLGLKIYIYIIHTHSINGEILAFVYHSLASHQNMPKNQMYWGPKGSPD
jgi:hypothetical protein